MFEGQRWRLYMQGIFLENEQNKYQRLYTDNISERSIFAYQQANHRINKNKFLVSLRYKCHTPNLVQIGQADVNGQRTMDVNP